MSLTDLLPVPLGSDLSADGDDALKKLVEDYNSFKAVTKQNTDRLGQVSLPSSPANRPQVGGAVAYSDLDSLPFILGAASLKQGLQLANGSDRGKVNVTFTYLGVGPYICGSGVPVTYTADLAVAGAGGLDTPSEAADTWYAVYVIAGPAAGEVKTTGNILQPPARRQSVKTNVLLAAGVTAPVMPVGFNRYRRVGWVRNNASKDLYRFVQATDSPFVEWNEDISAGDFYVLGVTTSAVAYTDVVCTACVPPTSRRIMFVGVTLDGGGTGAVLSVKNKDSANVTYTVNTSQIVAGTGVTTTAHFPVGCDASQTVQYRTNATTNDAALSVLGYYDVT